MSLLNPALAPSFLSKNILLTHGKFLRYSRVPSFDPLSSTTTCRNPRELHCSRVFASLSLRLNVTIPTRAPSFPGTCGSCLCTKYSQRRHGLLPRDKLFGDVQSLGDADIHVQIPVGAQPAHKSHFVFLFGQFSVPIQNQPVVR